MDVMDSRLEALLRHHEGERLKPYTDTTGHLTIGVGRNLTDVGITAAESEMLLRTDVARTRAAVCRAWPWVEQLDPVRQAVVLDMAFNLGVSGLKQFKRTMALLKHGRWEAAADAMLDSLWAQQVGQRAVRLAQMVRTMNWPEDVA